MIGLLRGRIAGRRGAALILDVGGVGYLVQVSATTSQSAGGIGSECELLIETQMRENAVAYFGFTSDEERETFVLLTAVQGVGSKIALALLSSMTPGVLMAAIAADDRRSMTAVTGVGAKLAARICADLAGKASSFASATPLPAPALSPSVLSQVKASLKGLGYTAQAAETLVSSVCKPHGGGPTSVNDIVKACLVEASLT